ncbi:MAG: Hpt domain-containing protein [bacterium]
MDCSCSQIAENLFDYKSLKNSTGLSDDFLKDTMLRDFLVNSRRQCRVLEKNINEKNTRAIEKSAHKLKGYLATLHMTSTAEMLGDITENADDINAVNKMFDEVSIQLNTIRKYVSFMLKKYEENS